MGPASYLPSPQFSLILTSIVLAGGLVWAADYVTSPKAPSTVAPVETPSALTTNGLDWKAALAAIQGENTLPEPPSEAVVASLLSASETNNTTASVGRSILINLGEAKAQGLGSDIPTQERIVKNALAKIEATPNLNLYTTADLTVVADNPETLRAYGNQVITVFQGHVGVSVEAVMLAVGEAIDSGNTSKLATLTNAANSYRSIARELSALAVPQTLTPLHLQVVNNFARLGVACGDMGVVLTDPLRAMNGIKTFQMLTQETGRLFISVAQALQRNGILFSESEPGVAWSLMVAS